MDKTRASSFSSWFDWPMRCDGHFYNTDDEMKSLLAEIWIFEPTPAYFYRAWQEGVKCGRIFQV